MQFSKDHFGVFPVLYGEIVYKCFYPGIIGQRDLRIHTVEAFLYFFIGKIRNIFVRIVRIGQGILQQGRGESLILDEYQA